MDEFKKAWTLDEYKDMLKEQKPVYDLHYKKAVVPDIPPDLPELNILIITVPKCGDSTATISVLEKYLKDTPAEIRIVLRDDEPQLMDQFLTNGKRAIPVVIVMDADGNYLMRFGPRSEKAQDIFEQHREDINEGRLEASDVRKKIRHFYARDRGKSILQDFTMKLNTTLKKTV